MPPTTTGTDTETLRETLAEVRDPRVRYHLRQALQYAVAADTDGAKQASGCR
jgi:hypothetical protein